MPEDNWPKQLGSAMESNDVGREFPFEDVVFGEQRKTRARLTRADRWQHNQQWAKVTDGLAAIQLEKDQEEDPCIQRWMAQEDHTCIKRNNRVLCRIWRPSDSPDTVYEQIVLPKMYHQWVIRLAHDIPFAGHLGREKTARILLR